MYQLTLRPRSTVDNWRTFANNNHLSSGDITIIHSDNGSEFAGEFERACQELGIQQVYSRVRTPKDNPALERFNWTVQDEWLSLSEVGLDEILEANLDLTDWLIEYNNHRPHEALDYQTPLAYAYDHQVLPMTPARTLSGIIVYNDGRVYKQGQTVYG